MKKTALYLAFIAFVMILASCGSDVSNTTGWNVNDPDNGGFEVQPYEEQETGPGLVFVEGGTFTMGRIEQDVMYDWNNIPRRMTVSSFYMDETEVTNVDYREYLYWLERVFGADYPEVVKKALPDTLVWRRSLGYFEEYVKLYLRHPAYHFYPVVGINWKQADEYTKWRTDRVNEMILIREGVLQWDYNQVNEENFNTEAYLAGQYIGMVRDNLYDYNPNNDERRVKIEDGIFLPRYRLPTEAEWEFAAYGLIGNSSEERIIERRLYPWNGHVTRMNPDGLEPEQVGMFMANFVRGRGDYMGTAGGLNDKADITTDVRKYWPNDYGLYCMVGNVNEWVMDVYRPMTMEDMEEFRGFRGNVFETQERDMEGLVQEKDTLGKIQWRPVAEEESINRRNYKYADNINYGDGDYQSTIYYDTDELNTYKPGSGDVSSLMYFQGTKEKKFRDMTSMINDQARVYKGGSWRDRAYWLVPGTRRFLDEKESTDDIGFRCAMFRVGSQESFYN